MEEVPSSYYMAPLVGAFSTIFRWGIGAIGGKKMMVDHPWGRVVVIIIIIIIIVIIIIIIIK